MRKSKDTIAAHSARNYHRRWEGNNFNNPDVKVLELWDYVGDGNGPRNVDISGEVIDPKNHWEPQAGNNFGVKYSLATDFVHAFKYARFDFPVIVDMGEMPAHVDKRGEPIGDPFISMAGMFAGSNLHMLPRGGSRGLVSNVDAMFSGCTNLRYWGPQALVAAGLAMVADPEANRRLRSNGLDESAFLYDLAPLSMKQMFMGCTAYNGHAVNAIDWRRLAHEDSASDFATGCEFAPVFLNATIDRVHWLHFHRGGIRAPLKNVNLGNGRVTGDHAKRVLELRANGIMLIGFELA